MSDTPRTDAEHAGYPQLSNDHFGYRMVRITFARQLERELTVQGSELTDARAEVAMLRAHNLGLQSNVEKLREALTAAADRLETVSDSNPDYWASDASRDRHAAEGAVTARAALASTAEVIPTIDLDAADWRAIKRAASESTWMPPEYCRNDWVSDVCVYLRGAPSPDVIAVGDAIVDYVPPSARATIAQLAQIDLYVKVLWCNGQLPSPMPETLRDRLGAQPLFP